MSEVDWPRGAAIACAVCLLLPAQARAQTSYVLSAIVASGDPSPLGGVLSSVSEPAFLSADRVVFLGSSDVIVARQGASGDLVTVVAAGDAVPGGGVFRQLGTPVVGPAGEVVFWAAVHNGAEASGIYRWREGAITPVVVQGEQPPGIPTPFQSFGSEVVADASGRIVFSADAGRGVFRWSEGEVTVIAASGGLVVGLGSFRSFEPPVVNRAGDVLFSATVDTFGSDSTRLRGLFLWSEGAPMPIVLEGDPNPCEGSVQSIDAESAALGEAGDVAFVAKVPVDGPRKRALFRFDRARRTLSSVVCPEGLGPLGSVFKDIFGLAFDGAEILFAGKIKPAQPTSQTGIFLHSPARCAPADLCAVIPAGTPISGGAAVTSSSLTVPPSVLEDGSVVLQAFVSDGQTALLRWRNGTVQELARSGGACPGGGTFLSIGDAAPAGGPGSVVFEAECSTGSGLFRIDAAGSPTPAALASDATRIGRGFVFELPQRGTGETVSFKGTRKAIFAADCASAPCAVSVLAAPFAPESPVAEEFVRFSGLQGGAGEAAFLAQTTNAATGAIFAGPGGAQERIAEDGDALGASAEPVSFIGPPSINGVAVAFSGALALPGGTLVGAGFVSNGGKVQEFVREGQPAPEDGTFRFLGELAVHAGGEVAFTASKLNLDVSRDCVFFRRANGLIQQIACSGDALPSGREGVLGSIFGLAAGDGRTLFRGQLSEGPVADCLLERGPNGNLAVLFCGGDRSPIGPFFENGAFGLAAVGAGGVAFTALAFDEKQFIYRYGIYLLSGGGRLTRVALDGDPAPAPLSGTLAINPFGALNRGGSVLGQRISFSADLGLGATALLLARPEGEEIPTATVTPTPTDANATPVTTPTPSPTATTNPSSTSTPSSTPTSVATLAPTPSPSPTRTRTPTASPTPTPSPASGDANCDDTVSAADLPALVTVMATGKRAPCGLDDLTGDGKVSSDDLLELFAAIFAPSELDTTP